MQQDDVYTLKGLWQLFESLETAHALAVDTGTDEPDPAMLQDAANNAAITFCRALGNTILDPTMPAGSLTLWELVNDR